MWTVLKSSGKYLIRPDSHERIVRRFNRFFCYGCKNLATPVFAPAARGTGVSIFRENRVWIYFKKWFYIPLQEDPDKHWHWHWHSPRCVSTGSPRLWELASIFWPRLSSKILPSRGEHGKRGYSVWVVGTNVFFSFQECKRPINLQKTVHIT